MLHTIHSARHINVYYRPLRCSSLWCTYTTVTIKQTLCPATMATVFCVTAMLAFSFQNTTASTSLPHTSVLPGLPSHHLILICVVSCIQNFHNILNIVCFTSILTSALLSCSRKWSHSSVGNLEMNVVASVLHGKRLYPHKSQVLKNILASR